MLADVAQQPQVVQAANADQIQTAKQQGVRDVGADGVIIVVATAITP